MKKVIMLFLVVTCVFSYQSEWFGFDENQNPSDIETIVMRSDSNFVHIAYSFEGIKLIEIVEDCDTFYRVSFNNGSETLDSIGLPELPVISDIIAIPDCDSVIVNFEVIKYEFLDSILVYPKPETKSEPIKGLYEVFTYDTSYYAGNNAYPSSDFEYQISSIREQDIVIFDICPFVYDPAKERLTVATEFEVYVELVNPSSSVVKPTGPMRNFCNGKILNYDMPFSLTSTLTLDSVYTMFDRIDSLPEIFSDTCDYLIIVADSLYESEWIDSFAEHKEWFNGFDVRTIV